MDENLILDERKIAVLVLSYCLYKDGTRLTEMARRSAEIGVAAVCDGEAASIIFSTAYDCWKKEAELKKLMANRRGISYNKIYFLEGVTRTSDEVSFLKDVLKKLGANKLIVICEKYHVTRATRFLEDNFPGLEIEVRSFQT